MSRLLPWGWLRVLALAGVILLAAAAFAAAQEAGGGTQAAAGSKKPPETILELIVAGGPMNIGFMVFLGLFSLVAATVALERLVNLRRGKFLPPDFTRELRELARREETRLENFRAVSERSTAPAANILRAALRRAGRPVPEVEKTMEDAAAREMAALRSRVRPLNVIANVAPLVGLLGTVVGMLQAFRIASQVGLGKAEVLAEGIYLALETTVAGLLIAIPCLLLAAYFNGRNERFMHETDDLLTDTIPCFARMAERGVTPTSKSGYHAPSSSTLSPRV